MNYNKEYISLVLFSYTLVLMNSNSLGYVNENKIVLCHTGT